MSIGNMQGVGLELGIRLSTDLIAQIGGIGPGNHLTRRELERVS
jgi:hypothetical protein